MITYTTDKLQKVLLSGGCEQRNLPSGYTQVEYLESSGMQWIDTGYKPNTNTVINVKYYPEVTSSFICIYGTQDSPLLNRFYGLVSATHFRLLINSSKSSTFWGPNKDGTYVEGGMNGDFAQTQCIVDLTIDNVNKKISIKSNEYTGDISLSDTVFGENLNCTYNMLLFSSSTAGTAENNFLGKIYGFSIKDNGALIQNLIPARRNSDNVLGMYDTVSGNFLTNQGTGTFTAGADVVPTPDTPMDIVCNNGVVKVSKNLFDISTSVLGGLSSTDGSEIISTTRAKTDFLEINNSKITVSIDVNDNFAIINSYYYDENKNYIGYFQPITSGGTNSGSIKNATFIVPNDSRYVRVTFCVYMAIHTDINLGTFKQSKIQIEQGSTATPYMPYGQVYTNGTTETVESTGKNLLDTTSIITGYRLNVGLYVTYGDSSSGGSVTDFVTDKNYYISNLIPVEVGKTYVKNSPLSDAYHRFKMYNANKVSVRISSENSVTIQSGEAYIAFCGLQTEFTTAYCGELLGTATAENLFKVGDYQDVQSVLDGSVTRNVGINVFDGSENWLYDGTYSRFLFELQQESIIQPNGTRSIPAYCTHFKILSNGEQISSITPGQGYIIRSASTAITGVYMHSTLTTVAEFKQYLAQQYAQGTPVIVIYPLATPTTEQVTPQPLSGSTATVTAGSIDNLPIESSTIAELKKRYIGTAPVGRVYVGNNLIWETKEGYGVRWVHGDTSGSVERIGNMEYHRTLPIQSSMKRCIRKENGDIQYISSTDWTKDTDGNTINYNAEGQDIMVEVPEHYYEAYQKVENGVTYDYLILYPTVRLGKKVPKHYLGAFKAMLNRNTNKLYSTVKIDTNSLYDSNGDANGSSFTYPANASTYRGGGNDTAYDNDNKTLFGRPVSNINIRNFCTYAKNRGDGYALKHWESHWCLWRLFVVEYATLNCQDTFTEALTADGYYQGGLGFGLCSTVDVWSSYNNYNPIAPCGITLRLGSKTGVVKYTPAAQYSNVAYFEVPSYRGVENPFADIWEITNGLYIVGADSKNYIMTVDNGWYVRDFNYGSTSTPITGFTSRTADKNLGLISGWTTDFIWDNHGDIIPTVINTTASNTTDSTSPFRDYFWCANTGAKMAMLGGSLSIGVRAGLASLHVDNGVGSVFRASGSRLLYIPPVSN